MVRKKNTINVNEREKSPRSDTKSGHQPQVEEVKEMVWDQEPPQPDPVEGKVIDRSTYRCEETENAIKGFVFCPTAPEFEDLNYALPCKKIGNEMADFADHNLEVKTDSVLHGADLDLNPSHEEETLEAWDGHEDIVKRYGMNSDFGLHYHSSSLIYPSLDNHEFG